MSDFGAHETGAGRFVSHRKLGSGGIGDVYLAFDRERDGWVALKVLRTVDPDTVARFKNEFRSLTQLTHPNLVGLYELLSEEGEWFFTMEPIDGCDFLAWVRPRSEEDDRDSATEATRRGPTSRDAEHAAQTTPSSSGSHESATHHSPLGDTVDYERLRDGLRQLTEAVQALHDAGKLHRDIKPSNVLVTREGQVAVCDFGLVTDAADQGDEADASHDRPRMLVGTPSYMSPEQAAGRALSEASDWYSVGVLLYRALTGSLPFSGNRWEIIDRKQRIEPLSPRRLDDRVPADLDQLCADLLRLEPGQRPSGPDILQRVGASPGPTGTVAGPDDVPLTGRERHLAQLWLGYEALCAGHMRTIAVHGSSGMGKTALLRRFLSELRQRGEATVLEGCCYEQESVPYKAVDALVDALARHLEALSHDEQRELVPPDLNLLAKLFPVLGNVARGHPSEGEPRDPQQLRSRAFDAMRELLTRLSKRRPLVVSIDDLQWGDTDSALLLADLVRPPNAPNLLLVVAYRDEEAETSPCLRTFLPSQPQAVDLPVGPLGEDDARRMLAEQLKHEHLSERALDKLVSEAQGTPFFLAELAHYRPHAQGPQEEPVNIQSVGAMVAGRIERLGEEERALLEAVAVAARPIPQGIARRAAGVSRDPSGTMSTLRAARLVRTRGLQDTDWVETYHDRIRETIRDGLSSERLQGWHRALAESMEAWATVDAETLAMHYEGAGDGERAAAFAIQAADAASEAMAFDRAARLYRLALREGAPSSSEAWEVYAKLGDALANAGRGPEAAQVYTHAADQAPSPRALDLRRKAAERLLVSGHVDDGIEATRRVLAEAGMELPKSPRHALVSVIRDRAQISLRSLRLGKRAKPPSSYELARIDICWSVAMGLSLIDPMQGIAFQGRHLLLALRAGTPYRVARALAMEGGQISAFGTPMRPRVERTFRAAEAASRLAEDEYTLALLELTRGSASLLFGDWTAARAHCEMAERILRDRCTGVVWELDTAQNFHLWVCFYQGDIDTIVRRAPHLLRAAEERGDRYAAMGMRTGPPNMAWLVEDRPDEARRQMDIALQQWSKQSFHLQHYFELFSRVHCDLYCGQGAAAFERMQNAWPAMRASLILSTQYLRAQAHYMRGCSALWAAVDKPRESIQMVAAARSDARRLALEHTSWCTPMADLLFGAVVSFEGHRQTALKHIDRAVVRFNRAGMPMHAAAAKRRRGQLLGGDTGKALIEASEVRTEERGIRKPAAWCDMLAPPV